MTTAGRKTGWRKKDQKETIQICRKIEKSIAEWLLAQENHTETIEKALIYYREKLES